MSQTTAVYETYYQTELVAAPFAEKAFAKQLEDLWGEDNNTAVYESLRDATLKSDANTPIYPTKEQVEKFEQQDDTRKILQEHRKNSTEVRLHRQRLWNVAIKFNRHVYFKETQSMRALGEGTDTAIASHIPLQPPKWDHTPLDMGRYVYAGLTRPTEGGGSSLRIWLLNYMRQAWGSITLQKRPESEGKFICLCCNETFTKRNSLTRHCWAHVKSRLFDAYVCPRCADLEGNGHVVHSPSEWEQPLQENPWQNVRASPSHGNGSGKKEARRPRNEHEHEALTRSPSLHPLQQDSPRRLR